MSVIYINSYQFAAPAGYDADAQAYITAVETADGQALETAVKDAINTFVVDCKADGIWSAIKASCILAGARTLAGALVPLAGTAPTNYNFVAGDYNRKTGLKGDKSTKYLNANQGVNALSNHHLSSFISEDNTSNGTYSAATAATGSSWFSLLRALNVSTSLQYGVSPSVGSFSAKNSPKFCGLSQSSSLLSAKQTGSSLVTQANSPSAGDPSVPFYVFADNQHPTGARFISDYRLSFYSFGESLDLALLEARVTDLITAFAAAIP